VAAGFADVANPPTRRSGFRRWLPLAIPAMRLLGTVSLLLFLGPEWFADDATRGERYALRASIWSLFFYVVLALAAFAAIRRADRDAAWRVAAWAPTVLVLLGVLARFV
jgi:hypothetical protein